jgi:hypothetical protein
VHDYRRGTHVMMVVIELRRDRAKFAPENAAYLRFKEYRRSIFKYFRSSFSNHHWLRGSKCQNLIPARFFNCDGRANLGLNERKFPGKGVAPYMFPALDSFC